MQRFFPVRLQFILPTHTLFRMRYAILATFVMIQSQFAKQWKVNSCFSYRGRRKSLLRAISSTPFFRGGPRTGAALKYVKKALFRSSSRRRRKVLFVITHGKSYDNVAIPAAILRRAGVEIIIIGVGRAVNFAQLRQMAGKRRGAVFISSFRTLLPMAKAVEFKACRGEDRTVTLGELNKFWCTSTIVFLHLSDRTTTKTITN